METNIILAWHYNNVKMRVLVTTYYQWARFHACIKNLKSSIEGLTWIILVVEKSNVHERYCV